MSNTIYTFANGKLIDHNDEMYHPSLMSEINHFSTHVEDGSIHQLYYLKNGSVIVKRFPLGRHTNYDDHTTN